MIEIMLKLKRLRRVLENGAMSYDALHALWTEITLKLLWLRLAGQKIVLNRQRCLTLNATKIMLKLYGLASPEDRCRLTPQILKIH